MNKNYINIIIILFCLTFIFICFQNSVIVSTSIIDTFQIFLKKVFPFLFAMMVINNFLIRINLPYYLSKFFKSPYIYIFITSILCGCPTNAIIIQEFLENKSLNEDEASIAICFSTINNPLFLFNYFNLIFPNTNTPIKLLSIIYLGNLIILLWFWKTSKKRKTYVIKKELHLKKDLINSITSSLNNLLNIFAIIIFAKLLCDLLFPSLNIISALFKGLIEITQGLNAIQLLNISYQTKELLSLVILSFAGLSIHIQIANILENYNINYKRFYLSRIFLIVFSFIALIH